MAVNYYGTGINPYAGVVNAPYIPQQSQQANVVYMVLVNSEDEAKNYMLSPGNSMFFMDSNNSVFYTKSVDFSGISTFKKYEFHEVVEEAAQRVPDNYVTREEFEEWKKSMNKKPYYKKERSDHEPVS